MSEKTVERTGDRPLSFSGKEYATASSWQDFDPANFRWHEITVYEVERDSGGFVVAVSYRTEWDTETDHDAATVCSDAKEAAAWLREYDPLAWFIGPPAAGPGSPQTQRRERLMRDLKLRYEDAVSEVLGHLEPERVE